MLSGPLAAHGWRFTVLHPRYKKASGSATVVAGRTVAVAARFASGKG